MSRVRAVALVAVIASLGACADWVGEDVQSGDAAVIERPDAVATPSSTTSTVPPEPVAVRTLVVGACADDVTTADGSQPTTVDAVAAGGPVVPRACESDHRYELYAAVDLAGADAGWPGPEQVDEDALRQCTAAFESYVGVAWDASTLDLVPVVPDEVSWGAGDRQAWCVLFDLGLEQLEGSAAGTGS